MSSTNLNPNTRMLSMKYSNPTNPNHVKWFIFWLILLFGMSHAVYSQESSSSSAAALFHAPKQEKLYLHLDKPYYLTGDTIWLKGYLVDAQTHKTDDAGSRFIYVELIDRKNKVIQRKKIKEEHGSFSNLISLGKDVEEADYQIRAYTHFMRNQGEEFFFTKQVPVYANTTALLIANIEYEQNETGDKYAVVTLLRKAGVPYVNSRVEYMVRSKDFKNRFRRVRTNANGQIRFKLPELDKDVEPYLYIALYEKDYVLRKRLFMPRDYEYTVGFYPEGGHLLAGVRQQVAFKAETSTGEVVDVEGYVLNNSKDTLATFSSGHGGIGAFSIIAHAGDSLFAHVKDGMDNVKVFSLPKVSTEHVALAVQQDSVSSHYRVLLPGGAKLDEEFGLLVHTRGQIVARRKISRNSLSGSIPMESFPEGIAHFALYNKDTVVVSERLAFIRKASVTFQVVTSRNPSENRRPVKMGLRLFDVNHMPIQGHFSLSVTDDFAVIQDSTENNILSNLLLTSDLKGHVYAPSYYFSSRDSLVSKHLDQLLMTHGWRRFDVSAHLRPASETLNYRFGVERVQKFSGYVENHYTKKRLTDFALYVDSRDKRFKGVVFTDSLGRFEVKHDLPQKKDSMIVFTIQGKGKSSKWKYGVYAEEMIYPEVLPIVWDNKIPSPRKSYMTDVKEGYTLVNGEKVYNLPEVQINALNLPSGWVSYRAVEQERIEQYKSKSALDLLGTIPGIMLDRTRNDGRCRVLTENRNFRIRSASAVRNTDNPMKLYYKVIPVVLDGIVVPVIEDLALLRSDEVKSIDFVAEDTWNFRFDATKNGWDDDTERQWEDEDEDDWDRGYAGKGAMPTLVQLQKVYITTHLSKAYTLSSVPEVARVGCLSYAENAQFYAPKYPTEESRKIVNSDKRSTIHWEPNIRLNEKGEAGLSFYTADRVSTYTVVIEGITDEGQVCRYVRQIK